MRFPKAPAFVLLALSVTAAAQEGPKVTPEANLAEGALLSRDDTTKLANGLARCAALYIVVSRAELAQGHPATAEEFKNIHNGARVAAGYLLAVEHNARNPEDPRPISHYSDYLDGVIEAASTSFLSIFERNDEKALQSETAVCQALAETQIELVQMIRDDAADH